MKKKLIIFLLILVVIISLIFAIGSKLIEIDVKESPIGDYQIVSWLMDQGGFGYGGAYYIKEKGLFSKWYKLGTGPSTYKWLSDEEFAIRHSNPLDGNIFNYSEDNYYKEYNVNDFFTK